MPIIKAMHGGFKMKARILATLVVASVMVVTSTGNAAVPANAPAGTTGLCNDGSYYSGPTKKGACKDHKGVKEWYAEPAAAAKSEVPATTATAPATKTEAPAAKAGAPAASATAVPPGSTGLCNDGTYYTGTTKKGACKGHKGVKEWYSAPNDAMAAAKTAPASGASPAEPSIPSSARNTPAPTATPNAGNDSATTPSAKNAQPKVATAPAGSAGNVWINKSTKVYHCPGDRWYGKTKEGEYMPETQATAMGFKPDHGKPCK